MKPLEWLEAWAKARGYWRASISHPPRSGWRVCFIAAGRVHITTPGGHHYDLTPHVAWLWAHAVDTGREVRRRCPACVKRGGSMEWFVSKIRYTEEGRHQADVGARFHTEGGWIASVVKWGPWLRVVASRPCPTCSTKGYLDTPLARVVCEGAPTPWVTRSCKHADLDENLGKWADAGHEVERLGAVAWNELEHIEFRERTPGDPTARTELLAAAYGLNPGLTDEERMRWCSRCNPVCLEPRFCLCPGQAFAPEPHEATRLRDHLDEHHVRVDPATRTLAITSELAASSFRKPHGVLGQALALWLSGAKCRVCEGGRQKWTGPDDETPLGLRSSGWDILRANAAGWAWRPVDDVHSTEGRRVSWSWSRSCDVCHGDGTALAAYVAQQLELEQAGALEAAE